MNANALVGEIAAKVTKLKLRTERLEKENEALRNSVFNYLKEFDLQKNEIAQLNVQLKNNIPQPTLEAEKKKTQKEIDKYILLIDKCIASVDINLDK
jgi:hypothetical protein